MVSNQAGEILVILTFAKINYEPLNNRVRKKENSK